MRRRGHLIHCAVKGESVGLGGPREAAQLADELER
jgi:hypothetical protein